MSFDIKGYKQIAANILSPIKSFDENTLAKEDFFSKQYAVMQVINLKNII